jgi:hypothetical protein
MRLAERYKTLPDNYTGPTLEGGPSGESMAQLLRHVRNHVVHEKTSSGGSNPVRALCVCRERLPRAPRVRPSSPAGRAGQTRGRCAARGAGAHPEACCVVGRAASDRRAHRGGGRHARTAQRLLLDSEGARPARSWQHIRGEWRRRRSRRARSRDLSSPLRVRAVRLSAGRMCCSRRVASLVLSSALL